MCSLLSRCRIDPRAHLLLMCSQRGLSETAMGTKVSLTAPALIHSFFLSILFLSLTLFLSLILFLYFFPFPFSLALVPFVFLLWPLCVSRRNRMRFAYVFFQILRTRINDELEGMWWIGDVWVGAARPASLSLSPVQCGLACRLSSVA